MKPHRPTASVPKSRIDHTTLFPLGEEVDRVVIDKAHRTVAPCPILDRCGSCTYQAASYRTQLQWKQESLTKHLSDIGCAHDAILPIRGVTPPFGYRHRLAMPAALVANALRFGFYRRGTLDIVPAEGCPIQHPDTLAALATIKPLFEAHQILPTTTSSRHAPSKEGWLHAISLRTNGNAQCQLILSTKPHRVKTFDRLVDELLALPLIHSVGSCIVPTRSSYLFDGEYRHLGGPTRMSFSLANEQFDLAPATFFQTSLLGAEHLAEAVLASVPMEFNRLADLYGGAGIFAILTRRLWKSALIVEANSSAIADLNAASQHYQLTQVHAHCARVEQSLEPIRSFAPDVAIIDPPRKGCHPTVIDTLISLATPRIVYIACGFPAFLNDAARLINSRYTLSRVEAIDMFPHTTHLEVVARFDRGAT